MESDEESDDDSEYSEASEDDSDDSEGCIFKAFYTKNLLKTKILSELGSEEESGKDWSDLEREAAEEDNKDDYAHVTPKSKKSGRDRDRDRQDKHKSKNNHR